ncbi:MAG: hypothetical protein JNK54_09740 [Elusimicrobia bacterium]|nr:hypothetical protein [Elusimicrobiota bacterium]
MLNLSSPVKIFISFLVLFSGVEATADTANFLSHGPGAKAQSLGESFVAIADDPSAAYWNPAGIRHQNSSVMMEHTPIEDGGRLNFAGGSLPIDNVAFGFGVYQFFTGGVEGRASIGAAPTTLSVSQTVYFLPIAASTRLGDIGIGFKRLENHFGTYNKAAQGIDVGILREFDCATASWMGCPKLSFGAVARNLIEPKFNTSGGDEIYPREYSLGASLHGRLRQKYDPALNATVYDTARFTLDDVISSDGSQSIRVGGEYVYRKVLAMRFGWNDGVSAGLGIQPFGNAFLLDYAMSFYDLDLQHKVSMTYRFQSKKRKGEGTAADAMCPDILKEQYERRRDGNLILRDWKTPLFRK